LTYHLLLQATGDERERAQLDAALCVAAWPAPGIRRARPAEPTEPGAPAWWHGDEDASQSFLDAMGVQLTDG
jgi:hypothetical protein